MALTETPPHLVGNVVGCSIGGSLYYAKSGTANESVGISNVTNSRSGGYRQIRPVNKMIDFSFTICYNADDPPAATVGTEFEIIWDETDGDTITSDAFIVRMNRSFNVDNDFTIALEAQSSGSYTVTPPA